ncbi:MAG: hypothetical protein RIS70_1662 [Planctomycetota bacterium]
MAHAPNHSPGNSKRRALRIPLDYVHTRDSITQWKWLLSIVVLLAFAAYWSWQVVGDREGLVVFSPGPVAAAHRSWNSECSACHTDMVPLRSDSWNWIEAARQVADANVQSASHTLNDKKCEVCHRVAAHHSNQIDREVPACAACHIDHRGAEAMLSLVADRRCVDCHADIGAHGGAERSQFTPPIASVRWFANSEERLVETAGADKLAAIELAEKKQGQHPEFRSLTQDPGNIKFNHALHLQPGIPAFDPKSEGKGLITLASLPEEFVAAYRRSDQPADANRDQEFLVQLNCNSCHEDGDEQVNADSRQSKADNTTGRLAGNPRPIQYERHCRACHPLPFAPQSDHPLPHGFTPEQIREYLFGHFARQTAPESLPERLIPERSIPGRSAEDLDRETRAKVAEQVQASERFLADAKTCCKCHIEDVRPGNADATLLPPLRPASIPATWFRLGHFDHRAHRQSACAECHVMPDAKQREPRPAGLESSCADDAINGPRDHRRVMILGRDKCQECHTPAKRMDGKGGARWDCAECHHYHGGAPPTREGL